MSDKPVYKLLPDGTRLYRSGKRYKPLAPSERKIGSNKPNHPDAVRFYGKWFIPLELLADHEREMPETRPDDQTLLHRAVCTCKVCMRPQAIEHWRRRRRRERLKP